MPGRSIKKLLSFLCCFLFLSLSVLGQQKSELEAKRKKLLKDIELTTKMLKDTKSKKRSSLNELSTLEEQIRIREELIRNISAQITLLNGQIKETNAVIASLEADLKALKDEYAKMIYYTYKHQSSYSKLLFLFSAESFNDAYQRVKYMRRYAEFRKKQADLISITRDRLNDKIQVLQSKKVQKQKLLITEEEQRHVLNSERLTKSLVLSDLKAKEKNLRVGLKTQQKNADRLNKAIEDIIKRELADARRRAEEARKKGELASTPEAAALSANFQSNKGKLPWPVERGFISREFGEQSHPVLKSVKIRNNGVDIKTNKGAQARALFEGVVANIVYNPGFHKAIIVRHGEFFTVYSNLAEALVKPGDKVQTKQPIGIVYTDEEVEKTEMHLEIWKGTTKLDPQYWIYRD